MANSLLHSRSDMRKASDGESQTIPGNPLNVCAFKAGTNKVPSERAEQLVRLHFPRRQTSTRTERHQWSALPPGKLHPFSVPTNRHSHQTRIYAFHIQLMSAGFSSFGRVRFRSLRFDSIRSIGRMSCTGITLKRVICITK